MFVFVFIYYCSFLTPTHSPLRDGKKGKEGGEGGEGGGETKIKKGRRESLSFVADITLLQKVWGRREKD